MKEANENTLKVLNSSVKDSVDFLEKFLSLDVDLCTPTSKCFINICPESGEYDLAWSNSSALSKDEYKSMIKYDLAKYYFQQEDYKKSLDYFKENARVFEELVDNNEAYATYFFDLNSLNQACEMMLDLHTQPTNDLAFSISYQHFKTDKKVLKKIAAF
jgi:tetratricopeptide (TPR) repeat protein